MRHTNFAGPHRVAGYTLIELMIVVAIIGILATIAMPMYSDYVTRSKITDATTKMGDVRTQMEKYFMDSRTYVLAGACGVQTTVINSYNLDPSANFTLGCVAAATTYTITATGIAARGMTGFVYTVDQTNAKTSAGPAGNYTNANCWAIRKDGSC